MLQKLTWAKPLTILCKKDVLNGKIYIKSSKILQFKGTYWMIQTVPADLICILHGTYTFVDQTRSLHIHTVEQPVERKTGSIFYPYRHFAYTI